jgi:hypothetical protein
MQENGGKRRREGEKTAANVVLDVQCIVWKAG